MAESRPEGEKETYYGYAPWWEYMEDEDDDDHSINCTCESCIQTYPERGILAGYYEDDDEDGPSSTGSSQLDNWLVAHS